MIAMNNDHPFQLLMDEFHMREQELDSALRTIIIGTADDLDARGETYCEIGIFDLDMADIILYLPTKFEYSPDNDPDDYFAINLNIELLFYEQPDFESLNEFRSYVMNEMREAIRAFVSQHEDDILEDVREMFEPAIRAETRRIVDYLSDI